MYVLGWVCEPTLKLSHWEAPTSIKTNPLLQLFRPSPVLLGCLRARILAADFP